MWEYFSLERAKAKKFLEDTKKERHEGLQGKWQQESPAEEVLEQVRRSADKDSTPGMTKFGCYALKDGDWKNTKEDSALRRTRRNWLLERIREACEKVAKDEARANRCACGRKRDASPSVPTLHLPSAGGPHLVGLRQGTERSTAAGGARCVWRPVRMKGAKENTGGADGRGCQSCKGFQSAHSAARSV